MNLLPCKSEFLYKKPFIKFSMADHFVNVKPMTAPKSHVLCLDPLTNKAVKDNCWTHLHLDLTEEIACLCTFYYI